MSEQLELIKELAKKLDEARIPYMISGSVAMNFYAQPRMTRDVDIIVEMESFQVSKMLDLFQKEFYISKEEMQNAISRKTIFNAIHNTSLIKIDFIVRKETPYRKEEFGRRKPILLEGVRLQVVSPEDLILSKLLWGKDSQSELQLKDARNLIQNSKNLDWDYLERWGKELSVTALLGKAKI